jgi:hypothetical protein
VIREMARCLAQKRQRDHLRDLHRQYGRERPGLHGIRPGHGVSRLQLQPIGQRVRGYSPSGPGSMATATLAPGSTATLASVSQVN